MEAAQVTIVPATTPEDLAAVRELCWAYRAYLRDFAPAERRITEVFYPEAKYAALMADLARIHARPRGVVFLARQGDTPVGCGMTQPLDSATAEIKRVYVTDAARGRGIARRLCERLIEQATEDGFECVVLDTSRAFTAARNLYVSLGFYETGPYQPIPDEMLPHLCFFERSLTSTVS